MTSPPLQAPLSSADEAALRPDAGRGAKVACVIPCYNVASLCGQVARQACLHAGSVIMVDDGSTDGTGDILRAVARGSRGRARLITLPENRGKGAALLEAFNVALADPALEVLVTMDGDGQHRPEDMPRLVAAWRDGADLVIGGRSRVSAMPIRSRIGNTLTGRFLSVLYRSSPADTQSGYRAIDRSLLEEIVARIEGRRYETETRILLLALTGGRRIASVPIPTLYLDGNRSSHYRPVTDSLRILATVLRWSWPTRRGVGGGRRIRPLPWKNP